MNSSVVDTSRLRKGIRNRPKGRQVDPRAADDSPRCSATRRASATT